MYSSLIGKIEKAKRYAEERHRINFKDFSARFKGDHDDYTLRFQDGSWSCTCHFFPTHSTCSHVMAIQRILQEMLPKEALASAPLTV